MGVSGAGKTTLLDTLASRFSVGVITGNILVDGNPRDDSFQVRLVDLLKLPRSDLADLLSPFAAQDRLRPAAGPSP